MTFDDIVNESTIEYVENNARKAAIRCWCGGETAKSDVGALPVICLESVYHDPTNEGRPVKIDRLYVAGPMTGYPESNYPLFNDTTDILRRLGYEVVNPAEFGNDQPTSYVDLLRKDLKALLDCDGVVALDRWWESVGARNEIQVAGTLKMPVRSAREWVELKS